MNKFYLIAATVLGLAAPAVAKEAKPADPAQTEVVAPATGAVARTSRAATNEQRYCVVETITGSRIPHKTCQTRAEWLRDGFDPLEK